MIRERERLSSGIPTNVLLWNTVRQDKFIQEGFELFYTIHIHTDTLCALHIIVCKTHIQTVQILIDIHT